MADQISPGFDEKTVRAELAGLARMAGPTPDLLNRAARRAAARRRHRVAGAGAGVLAAAIVAAAVIPGAIGGTDGHPNIVTAARPSVPAAARHPSVPPLTAKNPWVYTLANWKRTPWANPCLSTDFEGYTYSAPPTPRSSPRNGDPHLPAIARAGGGRITSPPTQYDVPGAAFTVSGRAINLSIRQLTVPAWLAPGTKTTVLPSGSVLELDRSDQKVHLYRIDGSVWDVPYFNVPIDNPPESVVQAVVRLVSSIDAAVPTVARPAPQHIDPASLCPTTFTAPSTSTPGH